MDDTDIVARLAALGFTLPPAAPPQFVYVPVVLHQGIAYVSGQIPKQGDDVLYTGKVGAEVSQEAAMAAAELCVLNALSQLRLVLGSLARIERVLKLTGFVASAPGFNAQPKVIDAASTLLGQVLGESGRHARSAIGVAELPRNVPVEIEMTLAIRTSLSFT
ncbi:MAG: RidA family protein [Devosia sp.]|uniref:RidA family protein n=1 Tax=Devosia sp. TaxID=1871048 RepID=UPI0026125891|nr:RidA family protein [Devosia sp.]MDB5531078.1 RidA family protein [Devosia sp.]